MLWGGDSGLPHEHMHARHQGKKRQGAHTHYFVYRLRHIHHSYMYMLARKYDTIQNDTAALHTFSDRLISLLPAEGQRQWCGVVQPHHPLLPCAHYHIPKPDGLPALSLTQQAPLQAVQLHTHF